MNPSIRKQMLTAAIATILAGPVWAATETNNQPENVPLSTETESGASTTSGTESSSGTGTSQSDSTYDSGSTTTSGSTRIETSGGALDSDTSASSVSSDTSAGSMDSSDTTSGSTRIETSGGALDSDTSAGSTGVGTTSTTTGVGGIAGGNRMADNPLYSRSADEMDGTDVVDATGDKIGEVDEVVLSQDRRSAHAVISVGGLLGLGARDITVSFDELHMVDDDTLRINATKEELESRPEYRSEQFVEVEGNQAISGSITDFAAFETDRSSTTGTGGSSGTGTATDQ